MTNAKITAVLEEHCKWVKNEGGERADLEHENLRYANLRNADLRNANLRGADLKCADLRNADLRNADLRNADLREADLRWAILSEADLEGATLFRPMVCPEKGSFIAWKKSGRYIVELEVLKDAKRSSATSRRCRCDKAKVLAIENIDGSESHITEVNSNYDKEFIYRVGEIVFVDNFDENRWNECAPGIHFFITREEAVRY